MVNSEAAKTTGQPVNCDAGCGIRSDNEASKRPASVSLGGFYTPDSSGLGYGVGGVSTPGGGNGGSVSQPGRARRSAG